MGMNADKVLMDHDIFNDYFGQVPKNWEFLKGKDLFERS